MKIENIMPERVKNYTGGAKKNTCCASWLKHWENNTGQQAKECLNDECASSENLVGAHVVDEANNLQITIFCQKCNIDGVEPKVFKVYKKDLTKESKSLHCLPVK
ncbi:hypothetical protein ACU5EH_20850 [Aliivibrio salmonicida]|uniref:hypothetical protein n=1 Tax=Aliivibrio salmonicida TaxID=40269 RepID=UPI00406C8630